jgi:hypothetical protein
VSLILKLFFLAIYPLLFVAPNSAQAQNIFDLLIHEAQRQEIMRRQQEAIQEQQRAIQAQERAARAAEQARMVELRKTWAGIDPYVSACADQLLQRNGQSIEALISNGLPASDPQLASIFGRCQPISSRNLMKNVECTLDVGRTRCDEVFVLSSAQSMPLTADQAATALLTGREIGKVAVETPAARTSRLAAQAEARRVQIADGAIRKLQPLLSPDNKFNQQRAAELRKRIESARRGPNASEPELIALDRSASDLVAAYHMEMERRREEAAQMLARGEVRVSGKASNGRQSVAQRDAVYEVFEKQLRELIGSQADGDVGRQFRKSAESSLDKFRAIYFTSDTKLNCTKVGQLFNCNLDGIFKVGVLKGEVQKLMTATVSGADRAFRFILGYEEKEDPATRFLIDSIRAEFINAGYRVIARNSEEEAIARGEVDYFLNILSIEYDDQHADVGSTGGVRFENYTLRALVKLLDNNKNPGGRVELANVPVLNTKRVPRDTATPKEARRGQLLPMQATELARQVHRDISARLLTIAASQKAAPGAQAASVRSSSQYAVKIAGMTQRDRQQIRMLRDVISKALSGVETRVDPAGTNDKSVEIRFEHPNRFDPEDLVDALYEAFKDRKTFKVRFDGANAFVGSL